MTVRKVYPRDSSCVETLAKLVVEALGDDRYTAVQPEVSVVRSLSNKINLLAPVPGAD